MREVAAECETGHALFHRKDCRDAAFGDEATRKPPLPFCMLTTWKFKK